MPRTNMTPLRTTVPAEGFYTAQVPSSPALPVRIFLPTGYEPNYPYPLVVFFHGENSSEEQVLRLAPTISRRNFICIGLRGPETAGMGADGQPGYSWGSSGQWDEHVEEYMLQAIQLTRRNYHVHSERIYLAGFCEGAELAYRLGLGMPDKIAGVISLNGTMPRPTHGGPLFRLPDVRQSRVFIGHGIANAIVPISLAKRDFRLLYSAGVEVQMRSYPTTHRLHPHMLRDINRWILRNVNDADWGTDDAATEA